MMGISEACLSSQSVGILFGIRGLTIEISYHSSLLTQPYKKGHAKGV